MKKIKVIKLKNGKQVGNPYNSMYEAAKDVGTARQLISRAISHNYKCAGYNWAMYKERTDEDSTQENSEGKIEVQYNYDSGHVASDQIKTLPQLLKTAKVDTDVWRVD